MDVTINTQKDATTYEENYGIVIFLDALGMKGVWKNGNPHAVLNKWNYFVEATKKFLAQQALSENIKFSVYAFSDTVIITIKKGKIEELILTASFVCGAIVEVQMTRELYFRGRISVGTMYEDSEGTIVLGPAVDEAASYYNLPNLVGVIAAPSAYSVLERLNENVPKSVEVGYVKRNIPFKDRIYKDGWILKLILEISEKITKTIEKPEFKNFKNLKEVAHYNLEHLSNVDAAEKWKNTLEFMNSIVEEKEPSES